MRWQGRRQSDNVEDMRGGGFGSGGGGFRFPVSSRGGGGLSLGTLVVLGVILWFMGINPLVLLDGSLGGSPSAISTSRPSASTASDDEMKAFVSTVLADTEDSWSAEFKALGKRYQPTPLVLFSGAINSACGAASASSGPFYCPSDRKVYIDLAFYEELRRQFSAPGDFAQAYVIAHEVGHHVQNLLGILPQVNARRRAASDTVANQLSVRLELQADCFAGVWGASAEREGLLEPGDLDEALNAARQIGDDAIQKRSQGYVVPETFNHGTSAQRRKWFKAGYDSGDMAACDTFGGSL